jgi:hypothetical protein
MNARRRFMKFAAGAALPASAALVAGVAQADDGSVKEFLGAWKTVHTIPGGSFIELLSFASGGVLTETNSFLHTHSSLDLTYFGVPGGVAMSASDGMGNWARTSHGQINVEFRKLLFSAGVYFGDFQVQGVLYSNGTTLTARWDHIGVQLLNGSVIEFPSPMGPATSTGSPVVYTPK